MSFPRSTGILLHPISLPSRGGIGDLGPSAYEFLDFLAGAKQGLWQVLPLGPPANGHSPYSSLSAFAGNPQLISCERLAERGWLDHARVESLPEKVAAIDYEQVNKQKLPLLRIAASNFLERADAGVMGRFERFCAENSWWLEDFVLFDSLRARYQLVDMADGGLSSAGIGARLRHNLEALASRRRWLGAGPIDYALFAKPIGKMAQFLVPGPAGAGTRSPA